MFSYFLYTPSVSLLMLPITVFVERRIKSKEPIYALTFLTPFLLLVLLLYFCLGSTGTQTIPYKGDHC